MSFIWNAMAARGQREEGVSKRDASGPVLCRRLSSNTWRNVFSTRTCKTCHKHNYSFTDISTDIVLYKGCVALI